MKAPIQLLGIASVLALLPLSGSSAHKTSSFTVDCSKNQTIASVIEKGDYGKPLLIRIKGTCKESVAITRDQVTLEGIADTEATIEAPDGLSDVISISANGVTLENLMLVGGNNGVFNDHGVRVRINNCVIQDTSSDGILSWGGEVGLHYSTIQRAGRDGLRIEESGRGIVRNSEILDNLSSGIVVRQNATIAAYASRIAGSDSYGVWLDGSSHGDFGENEITENQYHGMFIQGNSAAYVYDSTIANNEFGVFANLASTLDLNGNELTQNAHGIEANFNSAVQIANCRINANTINGINLQWGSKLTFEGGETQVRDNAAFAIWCRDEESSVNNLDLLDYTGAVDCTGF